MRSPSINTPRTVSNAGRSDDARTSCKWLITAQSKLKESFSDWHKEFVMADNMPTFKKKYPTFTAESELASFLKLKPAVDQLTAVTSSLLRAHAEIVQGF